MATRTMGVASKWSGVNGGHAAVVETVADFRIKSSSPPIPEITGEGQRERERKRKGENERERKEEKRKE